MSRVVLAAADEELILRVKQAADGDVHVLPSGRLPADPARLFEQLLDGELPDVLLIGPNAPALDVLTLAARLDVQSPGISVVLLISVFPGRQDTDGRGQRVWGDTRRLGTASTTTMCIDGSAYEVLLGVD